MTDLMPVEIKKVKQVQCACCRSCQENPLKVWWIKRDIDSSSRGCLIWFCATVSSFKETCYFTEIANTLLYIWIMCLSVYEFSLQSGDTGSGGTSVNGPSFIWPPIETSFIWDIFVKYKLWSIFTRKSGNFIQDIEMVQLAWNRVD